MTQRGGVSGVWSGVGRAGGHAGIHRGGALAGRSRVQLPGLRTRLARAGPEPRVRHARPLSSAVVLRVVSRRPPHAQRISRQHAEGVECCRGRQRRRGVKAGGGGFGGERRFERGSGGGPAGGLCGHIGLSRGAAFTYAPGPLNSLRCKKHGVYECSWVKPSQVLGEAHETLRLLNSCGVWLQARTRAQRRPHPPRRPRPVRCRGCRRRCRRRSRLAWSGTGGRERPRSLCASVTAGAAWGGCRAAHCIRCAGIVIGCWTAASSLMEDVPCPPPPTSRSRYAHVTPRPEWPFPSQPRLRPVRRPVS